MFGSSMVMTVGHALDRAKDQGVDVRVHVAGEWIAGRILSSDGHGVALLETSGDLCVLRTESISGVRMPQASEARPARAAGSEQRPHETRVPAQQGDHALTASLTS